MSKSELLRELIEEQCVYINEEALVELLYTASETGLIEDVSLHDCRMIAGLISLAATEEIHDILEKVRM